MPKFLLLENIWRQNLTPIGGVFHPINLVPFRPKLVPWTHTVPPPPMPNNRSVAQQPICPPTGGVGVVKHGGGTWRTVTLSRGAASRMRGGKKNTKNRKLKTPPDGDGSDAATEGGGPGYCGAKTGWGSGNAYRTRMRSWSEGSGTFT